MVKKLVRQKAKKKKKIRLVPVYKNTTKGRKKIGNIKGYSNKSGFVVQSSPRSFNKYVSNTTVRGNRQTVQRKVNRDKGRKNK